MKLKMLVLVAVSAFSVAPALAADPDFALMLRKVDELVTFNDTDFSAECLITQDKPGEGATVTKAALFRRDRENKYLILLLEPKADRGKGYLKIAESLWLYDPADRSFSFSSSKDRFQNSNARNSDFTVSNFSGDYTIKGTSRERLGRFDCWVLDLAARSADVSFPRTKVWISADNLVRKTEDYSLTGELLRTTAMPAYQQVGKRFVPLQIIIVDRLRGKKIGGTLVNEQTTIAISRPSLDRLPDSLLTKAYLEKYGR